ncbi:LOW QUALITY PROTEIN: hypothetical protein AAY473_026482, partial [Plecturocebus cupreus]
MDLMNFPGCLKFGKPLLTLGLAFLFPVPGSEKWSKVVGTFCEDGTVFPLPSVPNPSQMLQSHKPRGAFFRAWLKKMISGQSALDELGRR